MVIRDVSLSELLFMTDEELKVRHMAVEEFKKDNPHLEQVISAPNFITRRDGDVLKKAGHGWNEVLQKIGSHHPSSNVAKTNIRRSAKEVKTAK